MNEQGGDGLIGGEVKYRRASGRSHKTEGRRPESPVLFKLKLKGEYEFTLTEDKIFYTGKYQLNVGLSMAYGKVQLQYLPNIMTIEFEDYVDQRIAIDTKSGLIINQADFEIEPV